MMSYEEFLKEVKEGITSYLPQEFQDAEIHIEHSMKVNRDIDCLTVRSPQSENIAPTVDMKKRYEDIKNGSPVQEVMKKIAGDVVGGYEHLHSHPEMAQVTMTLDRVYMQLINTESNRDLLESAPHREFQDMSVVYRILVGSGSSGIESILIKNDIAESYGWSEQELFDRASTQTMEFFPPKVQPMYQLLMGMLGESGMADLEVDELAEAMGIEPSDFPMHIITNDIGVNGATAVMYEHVLSDLAEKIGGDMYVLPSSVHEVIAIPTEGSNIEELSNMVMEINRDHVREEDRLSNQVFHYDQREHKLSMVSNPIIKGIKDVDLAVANRIFSQGAPQMPPMSMALA